MTTLDVVWEWIVSGLVQNFVWMIIAILFVQFVQRTYDNIKYGGWKVIVRERGNDLVNREISPAKLKELMDEPSEMSVFVKGVASPYEWINCDVLTDGKEIGLFVEDQANRRLVIDLDRNPVEKVKKTERTAVRKAIPGKKTKA